MQKSTKFWFEKKTNSMMSALKDTETCKMTEHKKLFYTIKYHSNGSCMHVLLTKHNATLKISKKKQKSHFQQTNQWRNRE